MASNDFTILDLPNILKQELREDLTKKDLQRIKKLKERRKKQKSFNYKQGSLKRKIRRELEKKGASESKIKREQNKLMKYNLSLIDNQLNKLSKKRDFYYIIDVGFGKPFRINIKDIATVENIDTYILQKYKKRVDEAYKSEKNKSRKKILGKLSSAIDYNLQISKSEREYIDEEMDESKHQYPILIELTANYIELRTP